MLVNVVNSNQKHTNNLLTNVWGKTIKATKQQQCESNKEHKILFTQFGVNEPNLGERDLRSTIKASSNLITMRFTKSYKNLDNP